MKRLFAARSGPVQSRSEGPLAGDENLGLALVDLCLDNEPSARACLWRALNRNAVLILDALDDSRPFDYRAFDSDDPTFNGFYWYLATASKKPAYSFLAPVVAEFDRRNPTGELEKPGLFDSAFFYRSSRYLQIQSTYVAAVLEAKTGRVVDLIRRRPLSHSWSPGMVPTADETSILKYCSTCRPDSGDPPSAVEYRVLAEGAVRWRKEYPRCVRAGFSLDYSVVIVYSYPSDIETGRAIALAIERIDPARGMVVSTETRHAILGEIESSFGTAAAVREYPKYPRILTLVSPDSTVVFEGNRVYGTFALRGPDGHVIRRFRFASDVE